MNGERFRAVVAVHLLLARGDSVLLLRRANTGYEDGSYSVPAGHLEGGETARAAGVREAAEEVGIVLGEDDLSLAVVMHRQAAPERVDFFFSATNWVGEPRNAEPDKCDHLMWAPASELPNNTVPYVRCGIDAWRSGIRYAEFGWD